LTIKKYLLEKNVNFLMSFLNKIILFSISLILLKKDLTTLGIEFGLIAW